MSSQIRTFLVWMHVMLAIVVVSVVLFGFIANMFNVVQLVVVVISAVVVAFASTRL